MQARKTGAKGAEPDVPQCRITDYCNSLRHVWSILDKPSQHPPPNTHMMHMMRMRCQLDPSKESTTMISARSRTDSTTALFYDLVCPVCTVNLFVNVLDPFILGMRNSGRPFLATSAGGQKRTERPGRYAKEHKHFCERTTVLLWITRGYVFPSVPSLIFSPHWLISPHWPSATLAISPHWLRVCNLRPSFLSLSLSPSSLSPSSLPPSLSSTPTPSFPSSLSVPRGHPRHPV